MSEVPALSGASREFEARKVAQACRSGGGVARVHVSSCATLLTIPVSSSWQIRPATQTREGGAMPRTLELVPVLLALKPAEFVYQRAHTAMKRRANHEASEGRYLC